MAHRFILYMPTLRRHSKIGRDLSKLSADVLGTRMHRDAYAAMPDDAIALLHFYFAICPPILINQPSPVDANAS